MITRDTSIEELVNRIPQIVSFLSEKGIRCIICGEAVWGTIGEAAELKGWDESEIMKLVEEINKME